MDKSNDELSSKKKEFIEFLEKASDKDRLSKNDREKLGFSEDDKELIHLNSLITKNISLFTKNKNYKLLAWLIAQLIILSLFILVSVFLKNNFVPYLNSI
tara:strand:+ start:218 stop:517 length:300 start_codon:yes stop_codon:yes gene_type:complete